LSAFYGDLNIGSVSHGAATTWYLSLPNKKPPWLVAAFCILDSFFLILVKDLEIGAPAEHLLRSHLPNLRKGHAKFFSNAKLEKKPVVLTQFGA
jgi:hypothetical protein